MLATQFGNLIKAQRIAKNLSQKELARMAKVSRTVLSRLEGDSGTPVRTDILDRLFSTLEFEPRFAAYPHADESRKLARLEQQLRLDIQRSRHYKLAVTLVGLEELARQRMIERALGQVAVWREKQLCSPYYIARWQDILSLPMPQMAVAMTELGEWENALFQNTPWSWAWN